MISELFKKLEVIRIPLAKHENKHINKTPMESGYAKPIYSTKMGKVGWEVHNSYEERNIIYMRTTLADEFLAATN